MHKNALTIFVTATNTDIGKTYLSTMLLQELGKTYKVAGFKPIETGVKDKAPDTELLYQYSNIKDLNIEDCVGYTFALPAAPYVAKGTTLITVNQIKSKLQKLRDRADIVIVEGAGGLMVPISEGLFFVDLIDLLGIDYTILLTPSHLGCINDTMLSYNLLKDKNISYDWCVNRRDDDFDIVSKPFFDEYFDRYLVLQDDLDKIVSNIISKMKA